MIDRLIDISAGNRHYYFRTARVSGLVRRLEIVHRAEFRHDPTINDGLNSFGRSRYNQAKSFLGQFECRRIP